MVGVGVVALWVGGLCAIVAALSLDLAWLALIILPFWIALWVWVDVRNSRATRRGRFFGERRPRR